MTADKRSTHTDALETLGFILAPNQGARDAIHLAVEPVIAGHSLKAGDHIGIKDGKAVSHKYVRNRDVKLLGVVDPFLGLDLVEGEHFWLVVYPRQITSLRHVWVHPDFASEAAPAMVEQAPKERTLKEIAYQWIENYAESISGSYHDYYSDETRYAQITAEELIDTAKTHLREGSWGDYIVYGGKFEGESTDPEFWNQLEIYLEEEIPENNRRSFFSCSC
ncbi:hypothetical protein D3C87_323710 [compost metagenome]